MEFFSQFSSMYSKDLGKPFQEKENVISCIERPPQKRF